jgi:large subunit ribosomal protein L5
VDALREKYLTEVRAQLTKQFGYGSVMAVPRLEKVVINEGISAAREDAKVLERASRELALIALQRPVVTKAHRSISNFKLREGMPIGLKVTLRGERMFVFLNKLINIALPRIRDFRGMSANSFDGRGNYSLGVREQLIFPEITYDMVDAVRGMDVSIVTTARSDEEARALLSALGFPFRK